MERVFIQLDKIKMGNKLNYTFDDEARQTKYDLLLDKYEQFENLVVAKNEKKEVILVKGFEMFEALKRAKRKEAYVYYVGELSSLDIVALRVFLNVKDYRLNYVGIAEEIALHVNPRRRSEIAAMANACGLTLDEVERYAKLPLFDWNDFEKLKIDTGNKDLFGEEIRIMNNHATKKKIGEKQMEKFKKQGGLDADSVL